MQHIFSSSSIKLENIGPEVVLFIFPSYDAYTVTNVIIYFHISNFTYLHNAGRCEEIYL